MNLLKNLKKANNGITLIALVITIIVLLILTGVSIAMLTGENGILTQASNASKQTEIAQAKERAKLDILDWRTNQIRDKKDATLTNEKVKEILNASTTKNEYIKEIGDESFTTKSGYEILFSELDSSIESGGGNTEEKWTQPYEIAGFTHIAGEWNTGYVIQDDDTGSEFVWIPVGATINGVTINLDRVFYDDNLMTDEWISTMTGGSITSIDTFISSQFGVATKADYWNSFSEGADYITEFQESVVANGGFYIGRYEASYGEGGKVETVVSQKTRTSSSTTLSDTMLWNYISQTDAIAKCNEMYNGHESGIKSKLVNSYAWDTALKFINAVEEKNVDTDSNDWGNYNSSLANTGATSKAVACNIYDIAGNLYEWTTENVTINETTIAVYRGGYSIYDGASNSAGYRNGDSPTYTDLSVGFRPLLYK